MRVCIADQDMDLANGLAEDLHAHDYHAQVVDSREGVLSACGDRDVDLLLLDCNFQGNDEFAICTQLKESPQTRDVEIILLVERDTGINLAEVSHFGVVGYVTKPINVPMLIVRIDALVHARAVDDHTTQFGPHFESTYTDHLTGLKNRRYLMDRLQEEVEEAQRYAFPLTCVLFDLDEIQALDDELGPAPLNPVYEDGFRGGPGVVRFRRLTGGQVHELSIAQARVYDLRFTKSR